MNIFLILFLISLLGIVFMISRKMLRLRKGLTTTEEELSFEAPEIEEVKYIILKKIKAYGYIILILTLRFSIKSAHFAKIKSKNLMDKLKTKFYKEDQGNKESKEVSRFLKTVSEYKHKIKKIKHKIKEEEGLM